MKKILFVLLAAIVSLSFLLTSCNMSIGLGSYNFRKIHITTHNFDGCVEIINWHDNETGIEVKTKDGALFLSEGTYFLVEDKCPICDAENAE